MSDKINSSKDINNNIIDPLYSHELNRINLYGRNIDYEKYLTDFKQLHIKFYSDFLQLNVSKTHRENKGLEALLRLCFPIHNIKSNVTIDYLDYEIVPSQFSVREAVLRGSNYTYILKLHLAIKTELDDAPKNHWVIVGEIPAMTDNATFIINGHIRIFVTELTKCPGVVFTQESDPLVKGESIHISKLYPVHGSWLHFKLDRKGLSVSLDKKNKINLLILLKCFPRKEKVHQYHNDKEVNENSYSILELLNHFYQKTTLRINKGYAYYTINLNKYRSVALPHDIYDMDLNKIYSKNTKILDKKTTSVLEICCPLKDLSNLYLAKDVILNNGAIVYCSRPITELTVDEMESLKEIEVFTNNDDNPNYLLQSFAEEFSSRHNANGMFSYNNELTREQALKILARNLRLSAYHNTVALANIIERKFFDSKFYDLSAVGRFQLNTALNLNKTEHYLTLDDMIGTIKHLTKLAFGKIQPDNIDSLKKKVVYTCYDALYEYMRSNFNKWRDIISDRPLNLTQTKALSLALNISVLTQGITNKIMTHSHLYNDLNYISTMSQHSKIDSGSVGNSKERIPAAKRDIHPSQLGRICTIQTAEGKKVGLTTYMTAFCRIDAKHGFLLCPYYVVKDGEVTNEIIYLNSYEDEHKIIGDISVYKLENNKLVPTQDYILCLKNGHIIEVHYSEVELIMVANSQMNSIATSLVPRIETNDVYRSMVGANMHLQAMPTVYAEPPILSTGMDKYVANRIVAPISGKIIAVDMNRIIIQGNNGDVRKIELEVNKKTNTTTTCIYKPLVNLNDEVRAGELIADGFTTEQGDLAIGRNFLVMFTSHSYTYEDSAVVSQGVIEQGYFSSPRKSMHTCVVQDTRLGTEQLTKNIPGCSIMDIRHLDESGIVQIGAKVSSGDILVGKITPQSTKNDIDANESKLIKILLNDFDNNYRDTSLRVPPCTVGTVVEVEVLTSKNTIKDDHTLVYEQRRLTEIDAEIDETTQIVYHSFYGQFVKLFKKYNLSTNGLTSILNILKVKTLEKKFEDYLINDEIRELYNRFIKHKQVIEAEYNEKIADINLSYEIPDGHLKIIRVYIMEHHHVSVGDKIAGRCANKAVVSNIMSKCDMPYLPDGTPVDIILSSLGVIARMNNAQMFEAFIGNAIYNLRKKIGNHLRRITYGIEKLSEVRSVINELVDIATGVYNAGIKGDKSIKIRQAESYNDEEIVKLMAKIYDKGIFVSMEQFAYLTVPEFEELLKRLGSVDSVKTYIYDGKTGERSLEKVTVGYVYIMPLHHTAHSKIHARSTGPVSTMSLQPLYGRAYEGGQRFGEMEVWAEEAKGCSYVLQEMLNLKSDALLLKKAAINALIGKGSFSLSEFASEPSEGFRILASLLFAAGIDLQLLDNNGEIIHNWYHIDLRKPQYANLKAKMTLVTQNQILQDSKGEIVNAETHHFKSFEPVKGGLCDMAIFGPTKDYVCKCGELKGRKNEGLRCTKCKVLVASSLIRRQHYGHVDLAVPIAHPLFMRRNDNKIAYLLGYSNKIINDIVALDSYIISEIDEEIQKQDGGLYKKGDIISAEEYNRINRILQIEKILDYNFKAITGGEAIKYLIDNINLGEKLRLLKQQFNKATSEDQKTEISEYINCIRNIIERQVPLSGLVLNTLPICPANLRPIVELSPGNFAASDLNWLYKTLIIRNSHLKDMLESELYVDLMIKYQILLLYDAIDSCVGAQGSSNGSTTGKEYKSICEVMRGKDGLLRRQLLGKRVDFAGRAVIVTAPNAKLDECYLSEEIAIKLWKPHIMHKLIKNGATNSIKTAQEIIRMKKPIVYDILDEIAKESLVCLNRAPTLHRISIMYFKPIIWKHNTIGLNPLTCLAYNADFDGDQMAVHLTLSAEAISEAYILGRPSANIGSPAHGGFMIGAFKDMIYGLYALTIAKEDEPKRTFYNVHDAFMAYENSEIGIQEQFTIHLPNEMVYNNENKIITTIGRLKFMQIIPNEILQVINLNKKINKSDIQTIMLMIRVYINDTAVVEFVNKMQILGFHYATYFTASFGLDDFIHDDGIVNIINSARNKRITYTDQLNGGFISDREFDKKCMDLSNEVKQSVETIINKYISDNPFNPIVQIVDSGARGNKSNLVQVYGAKGNPVDIYGKTSSMMVFGNHVNGMSQLEYYSLSHGARKGIRDVALSTAEAGYLTRKLVDIANSCIVKEVDCKTSECLLAKNVYKNGKLIYSVYDQCLGRTLAKTISVNNITLKINTLITYEIIDMLKENDVQEIYIFSPVLCALIDGICVKCYGADLANMKPIQCGDAVGIIAAQSMGEPSTQLTMRSFHSGGVSKSSLIINKIISPAAGYVKLQNTNMILNANGKYINISRNMIANISNALGHTIADISIPYGAEVIMHNDQEISINDVLAATQTDIPFMAHVSGKVVLEQLFEGVNADRLIHEGINSILIKSHSITPIAKILNDKNEVLQQIYLPENTFVLVSHESHVSAGQMIGYIRKIAAGADITTEGLQYITNILDNRTPENVATIAPMSGVIKFKHTSKKNIVMIVDDNGVEHVLPHVDAANCIYAHENKVEKGDIVSFGIVSMQDILDYQGIHALIDYFVIELQQIYLSHSLNVNNKHFEVILSQMTRMYQIYHADNYGQLEHKQDIYEKYIKDESSKNKVPTLIDVKCRNFLNKYAKRKVLGITTGALKARSFLSQISFQTTIKGIIENAFNGAIDPLDCPKSCVITGKMIELGTRWAEKAMINKYVLPNV